MWRVDFAYFNTKEDMLKWINSSDGYSLGGGHADITTKFTENQFIMAYDCIRGKKIDISFKTEKKSLPKRVEYEKEEWKETKAEIKTQQP